MKPLILVVTEDFRLRTEIEAIAGAESVSCYFLSIGDHITEKVESFKPFLLVVDLVSEDIDWIFKHAAELKMTNHKFPMVACVSAGQESEKLRAQSAGFDSVFSKPVFLKKFRGIIQQYVD